MKKLSYACTLAFIFLLPPLLLHAQWTPTNGPLGGRITTIDTFGGSLWAGLYDGGIYKSTDNGTTWQRSDNGVPRDYTGGIRNLFPAPGGKLFAGTVGAGLYVTTNMGANWNYVPATPWFGEGRTMVRSGNVLVAGVGSTITRSTDNGTTWTQPTAGLPTINTYMPSHMAAANGAILAYLVLSNTGFYRSTDNGASWTMVAGPAAMPGGCDMMRAIGNRIYVHMSNYNNYQVQYTDDAGLTWHPLNLGNTPPYIQDIAISNNNYVIATPTGLMKAPVGGGSWSYMNGSLPTPWPLLSVLKKTGNGLFAGANAEGILKIDPMLNNTMNWSNTGLRGTRINLLHGTKGKLLCGVEKHLDIAATADGGQTWGLNKITNYYHDNVVASAVKSNLWYIGVQNMGFQMSADGGQTWKVVNKGILSMYKKPAALYTAKNATVYAADSNSIYKCVNDTAWTLVYTLPNPDEVVYYFAEAGQYLFAGSQYKGISSFSGYLYRSADGGQTWQAVSQSWHGGRKDVTGLVVQDNRIIAGGVEGPYVSANFGTTWDTLRTGLSTPLAGHVDIVDMKLFNGRVYASLNFEETLYELDKDSTVWKNLTPSATDPRVTVMWVEDTTLYAGTTNNGVWKRSVRPPSTIVSVGQTGTPSGHQLHIMPNPGKSAVITGDGNMPLPMALQVVHVSGRVVQSATVRALPYTVTLPSIPAGHYYLLLTNDTGRTTLKWEKTE